VAIELLMLCAHTSGFVPSMPIRFSICVEGRRRAFRSRPRSATGTVVQTLLVLSQTAGVDGAIASCRGPGVWTPESQSGDGRGVVLVLVWKAPLSSSLMMSPSLSTRTHVVQVAVVVQVDAGHEFVEQVEAAKRVAVPDLASSGEPGMNRGTNAGGAGAGPPGSGWRWRRRRGGSAPRMLITAPVTSSWSSCALSPRIASEVLPYLAALSSRGTLRPTPITKG